jgi:hypothetical protein
MNLDIRPYKGLGPIGFGMTREQVAAELGKSEKTDDKVVYVVETRHNMECQYLQGELFNISVFDADSLHYSVRYKEYEIFREKNILELLSKEDPPAKEKNGYINFYKLGFALGGFGKRKLKEGRVIVLVPDRETLEEFVDA